MQLGVAAASAGDVPGPPQLFVRTSVVADPTCAENETCQPPTAFYRLRVERINVGTALVVLCSRGRLGLVHAGSCLGSNDKLRRFWRVPVQPLVSGPGGVMRWWKSPIHRCPGPWNAYFRVQDPSNGRWSNSVHVTTFCTNL